MATADYTWSTWSGNAWEVLVDGGQSSQITYSKDTTDVAAKFVETLKSTTSSETASPTAGSTWEAIFGIPASSVVTKIQLTAWKKKLLSNTKLTSHTINVRFATVALKGGAFSLATTTDSSYVSLAAGSLLDVPVGMQASDSVVELELIYALVTSGSSGSAAVDCRFDDITIQATYAAQYTMSMAGSITPAGVAVPRVTGKRFVGGVTPASELTRRMAHGFAGTASMVGGVINQTAKAWAGTVATVGGLVRRVAVALVGTSITSSGSVATQKTAGGPKTEDLAGGITPGGGVVAARGKTFSGDL